MVAGFQPIRKAHLEIKLSQEALRDDRETQTRFAELRLWATQRIGELSRELDRAKNQHSAPANGHRSKAEALASVGIPDRTARDYEIFLLASVLPTLAIRRGRGALEKS